MAFTVFLPIKGTPEEKEFMEKSLKSAYALEPDELILALDSPRDPFLEASLDQFHQSYRGTKPTIKRIYVEKTDWNFQLAKIVWEGYAKAKHNKIYHYDIDHTVRKTVLMGQDLLDDDTVLVSFTKKLHIGSFGDLTRYFFYRLRTRTNPNVFSGNYWINKKKFYEIVEKESYSKIKNGIDTYLLDRIALTDSKMIMRKEIGVNALGKQNEDYDWRQFQDGVWLFAHRKEIMDGAMKTGVLRRGFFRKRPRLNIFVKSAVYSRWGVWKGYNWARKNAGSKAVGVAEGLKKYDWDYTGTQYLPKLKFKDTGTGHHDY